MEELNKKLNSLYVNKNWDDAVSVVFELCRFLNIETEEDFSLISDNQKINANVGRFEKAFGFIDRPATYELYTRNQNIEIKTFWVNKVSKTNLSWIVGISPNFEDGKVYQSDKYKVGIDIVIPKECDRVIILVSNNLKVRSLELKQKLSRTDLEIFEKLATLKNKSLDTTEDKKVYHNILWDAFNFEPINRKFYKELVDRFSVLRDHLLSKGFEDQDSVMFSTRLIGRLLFVWFLRKKNLINENVGYFDASLTHSQTEYYKNKLERLFFNTLNTEILERDFEDNKTPYLNGGLFEPTRTDFYKDQKLSFPDGYFSQFYEVLSHYNFTVDESSPEFEQVAVDPEMLGRIFESLLAEQRTETGDQARKAKGAFYTPREIVSYMCEESLKEYLKTKIEDDAFRNTRIQEIVSMSESAFRDQDHNKRRDWKPYQTAITQALDELTVLDPAVGSGAYPMGMLHLLVKVYTRIDSKYEKNLTKLKRDILSRSLYGSDIDSTAIEISRLRAWLSLVVDMEEGEQVAPLPNLEFHFVCANTLISLPKEAGIFDTPNLRENLSEIRKDYYNTNSKSKKETLRKRYEKLLAPNALSLFGGVDNELKTYHPFSHESRASFFDPDLMFGINKFDIVIGNPPYGAKSTIREKEYFKKNYLCTKSIKGEIKGSLDTYVIFIENGFNSLRKNGVLNFIVPISITSSDSMMSIQKIMEDNCELIKIASFSVRPKPIFENAMVNASILFFKRTDSRYKNIFTTKMYRKNESISTQDVVDSIKFIDVSKYKLRGRYPKISEEIEKSVLEKIFSIKTTIGDLLLNDGGSPIYYSAAGGRYYKVITNYPRNSSAEKVIHFKSELSDTVGAILSSNLYFWFYQIYSDNLNLKSYEISSFPIPESLLTPKSIEYIESLYKEYLNDIEKNSKERETKKYAHIETFKEYKIGLSKKLIDKIDDFIFHHYGLTAPENDYIKNYEISFRGTEEID